MKQSKKRDLANILARAEERMWADFEDAGAFNNTGDIGETREQALARFLSERLPSKYRVARGEVVDATGTQSGQTDILIYDGSSTSPLLTSENGLVLLPAEALLASIEVKSTLTVAEAERAVQGIARLRDLRPFASPWGLSRNGGKHANDGLPTFFSTIFAYNSTIGEKNWNTGEIERIRQISKDLGTPVQWLDRLVILSRGIVLPCVGNVATFANDRQVLGLWFYQLMNFLARESSRRAPFPWHYYERSLDTNWTSQLPPKYDAPEPKKASSGQRRKFLSSNRP